MSKTLKSNVETVNYRNIPGYRKVELSGWAFYTDETPFHFSVFADGKEVYPGIARLVRKDVAEAYSEYVRKSRIGFHMNIDVDKDVKEIKVKTSLGDTVVVLDEKALKKHQTTSLIQYHIDTFKTVNDDTAIVSGWAFSADREPVIIKVFDDNGTQIEAEAREVKRSDLVELNMIDRGQAMSGFYMQFPTAKDRHYTIEFSTDYQVARAPLTSGNEGGLTLIRSYFKAANPMRLKRALKYLRKNGVKTFWKRVQVGPEDTLKSYSTWLKKHSPTKKELDEQRTVKFSYAPKISVIVAAFNTPENYLKEMIDSVRNQTYSNWQLCIADGSTDDKVENCIRENYGSDERIRYRRLDDNYGIAGNMDKAIELADGDYVSLFDHDDLLTPDCLYEVVKCMQDGPVDVVYTDEDKLNDATKEFMDPHFKPDFAPDQLNSHNYITHFLTVKRELGEQVGWLHSEYDGSQDHDFILRLTELTDRIHHIPKILYHWRMHMSSTAMNPASKMYCYTAGIKAVNDHLARMGIKGKAEMLPEPWYGMYRVIYDTADEPMVSIIIPNKDEHEFLRRCVNSIYEKNEYPNFEILIVENNSQLPMTFEVYKQLEAAHDNLHVLTWDKPFNYAAINNFAASRAKGDFFLFLNNDTELIEPTSIREMVGFAKQDGMGAVGAKLLYPDDMVQHAGVVLGYNGYAAHAFTEIDRNDPGHMCRPLIAANYSAVTAACMMVSKENFESVGGFDEQFKVACNDVDFCLKLLKEKKRNVMTPFSLWYHYESRTRGTDKSGDSLKRFEQEVEQFQKKWPKESQGPDPYHNVNFDLDVAPFYEDF